MMVQICVAKKQGASGPLYLNFSIMNIVPVTQNNFSSALNLLKINQLPTEDISETTKLFVLEDEQNIRGTIAIEYSGKEGLLRSLSVDENKRNNGYGKTLVGFIEKFASEQGVKNLYLLTTTAESFFAGKAYVKVERNSIPEFIRESSEFSSVCPSSAVVMKKVL